MCWGASPQCSSLADLIAAIVGLPCFRCNGTKVAGVKFMPRILRGHAPDDAPDFACRGNGKAAWGRGFFGIGEDFAGCYAASAAAASS